MHVFRLKLHDPSHTLTRFDTEDVIGIYVNRNRAICVQPFVMAEGYIRFEIAIGDGKFNWKGKYFIGKINFNTFLAI
jgi:hypothetical protein